MAQIAALTIANGAATPVNHTFAPVNKDAAGVAKWADRVDGIAIGYPTVTYQLRIPTVSNRNYKLTARVALPVLEVTSPSTSSGIQPAPTLAYTLTANVEIVLPERSTLAQRNDLLAYVRNYLSNAVITSGVQNFESIF